MVICPNCGNENFLEAKFCIVCGREGCEGCMEQIFNFLVVGRGVFDWWICSEECFNSFIGNLVAAVPPQAINLNDYHGDRDFHCLNLRFTKFSMMLLFIWSEML
jgi:hypothetical protein